MKKALLTFLALGISTLLHAGGPYEGFNPTYPAPQTANAVSNATTFTNGTQGSVVFISTGGVLGQKNSQLFWDEPNGRLGIGNAVPSYTLDITGTLGASGAVTLSTNATVGGGLTVTGGSRLPTLSGAVSVTGLLSPSAGITVSGSPTFSSATIIDAHTPSFGAVTAGSTSTVTWTEVTDRLGEFVTSSFTAITAGYYEIITHGDVSQTAGSACLLLNINAVIPAGGIVCNQGVTALASILDISITRILNLAANDIVRVDASATTADATFQKMQLTIKRLP